MKTNIPIAAFLAAFAASATACADLASDVEFLVRYAPPQYGAVPGDFVTNNCLLAKAARKSAPEEYPDAIYLDYVLPYTVIREERDDWRAEFRERFAPLVAGATNAYDAAVALDRGIWDMINVHYNVRRDKARQSPRHSMSSRFRPTCSPTFLPSWNTRSMRALSSSGLARSPMP